jgi:hypothetical protein
MIHVPNRAVPTYPITRPIRATDRPSESGRARRVSARARCPHTIAGTEVRPKVKIASTPSANVQRGRVGKSSWAVSSVGESFEEEQSIITYLSRLAFQLLRKRSWGLIGPSKWSGPEDFRGHFCAIALAGCPLVACLLSAKTHS